MPKPTTETVLRDCLHTFLRKALLTSVPGLHDSSCEDLLLPTTQSLPTKGPAHNLTHNIINEQNPAPVFSAGKILPECGHMNCSNRATSWQKVRIGKGDEGCILCPMQNYSPHN